MVAADEQRFLLDVRGLIAASWTQEAEARTADGTPIDPWEPGAVSWSLLGALVAVHERRVRSDGRARADACLGRVCALLVEVVDSDVLSAWNDAPGRTSDDVLTVLSEAAR